MKDIKYKSVRDYLLSRESPRPFTFHELKELEKEQGLSSNPKTRELQQLNILIQRFTMQHDEIKKLNSENKELKIIDIKRGFVESILEEVTKQLNKIPKWVRWIFGTGNGH